MGNRAFFRKIKTMGPGPIHEGEPVGCLKVPYDAEADAADVGVHLRQTAYRCPKCGKWHLTKNPRFKKKDIGRRAR